MIYLIWIVTIIIFVTTAHIAEAFDFYGASVTIKEVPMSMWKVGLSGNYPIIDNVSLNSPAEKLGLSQGNIILSVNDKKIEKVSDLDTFATNILLVKITKGFSKETIAIDRATIEVEKNKRFAEEKKTIVEVSATDTDLVQKTLDPAPIVLNDAVLESKLGRSMPVQSTGNNDTYKEILYYEACKSIVKVILKAPGSASFLPFASSNRNYRSGKFVISSYVDSQNGFGAFLRAPWECSVDIQLHKVKDLTFKDKYIVRDFEALPGVP